MKTTKPEKVELIYYLMVNCAMMQGQIEHITKDQIDDTWFEEDLDEIIQLGQSTCSEMRTELKP